MNIKRTDNLEREINDEFDRFLKNDTDPLVQAINKTEVKKITTEEKEFLLDQCRTEDADVSKIADWFRELRKNTIFFRKTVELILFMLHIFLFNYLKH